MLTRNTILAVAAAISCCPAESAVFLDSEREAIRLIDYPPEVPCTLRRLAKLDELFGWGKVDYNAETSACTLTCNLIIGSNDSTETVLQVGTEDAPQETLVMKGNLYIHPYFVSGDNEGVYWRVPKLMNALVLGSKENRGVRAALKFACTPNEKYTLYCGHLPWIDRDRRQWGGGLYAYDSVVTALRPAPGYEIGDAKRGNAYLHGSVVLDRAEISWVKGWLYGLQLSHSKDYSLKDTLFDHVRVPLLNGHQKAVGCTFSNCETAVKDYGSLDAELIGCTFRSNARHWSLPYTKKVLVCVDCEWDSPRLGNEYRARSKDGKTWYPTFSCRRHIVVEVVDRAGEPIDGATVTFRAEQDGCDVLQNREQRTGADGRTPGKGQDGAILLTEFIKKATDVPNQPEATTFSYTFRATAQGYRAGILKGVQPKQSWDTFKIVLDKE